MNRDQRSGNRDIGKPKIFTTEDTEEHGGKAKKTYRGFARMNADSGDREIGKPRTFTTEDTEEHGGKAKKTYRGFARVNADQGIGNREIG
jgi:hypothetical protein